MFVLPVFGAGGSPTGDIEANYTTTDVIELIAYIILAILFSFLCSIAEATLLNITPSYLADLQTKKPKFAEKVSKVRTENIDKSLAGILTMNTIAHTVGAIGSGAKATIVFGSAWFGLFSAIMTLAILFFSEIIPKTIGVVYWRPLVRPVITFISVLNLTLAPFIWVSEKLTQLIAKDKNKSAFNRDEFVAMANLGVKEGAFNDRDSKILTNLFQLGSITIKSIFTPRTVMVAFQEDKTIQEVAQKHSEIPFSRLILYNENLEEVDRISYHEMGEPISPVKIMTHGDNIFITSNNNRLYFMNPIKNKGDYSLNWVADHRQERQLIRFTDIISYKNHVVWLDQKNNLIEIMTDQKVMKKIAVKGNYPISFSIYNDEIYVLDSETKKVSIYRLDGQFDRDWEGNLLTEEGNPNIIRISPKGIIAVAYHNLPHIRLFRENGEPLKVLSPFSNEMSEFRSPQSIAVDSDKRLFVIDKESNIHFYPLVKELPHFNKSLLDEDKITSLGGILYCSNDKLFLSDTTSDQVLSFHQDVIASAEVRKEEGKGLKQFKQPTQIARSKDSIYIIDKENYRVVRMNEENVIQSSFLIRGNGNNLLYPQDITVSPDNRVFVLAENQLLAYQSNGTLLYQVSLLEGDNSYMGYAKGIAYSNGVIYVSDTFNHRVVHYSEKGKLVGIFGSKGGDENEFYYPWDIVENNNLLYIVDKGNHRVVRYGTPPQKEIAEEKKDEKK